MFYSIVWTLVISWTFVCSHSGIIEVEPHLQWCQDYTMENWINQFNQINERGHNFGPEQIWGRLPRYRKYQIFHESAALTLRAVSPGADSLECNKCEAKFKCIQYRWQCSDKGFRKKKKILLSFNGNPWPGHFRKIFSSALGLLPLS